MKKSGLIFIGLLIGLLIWPVFIDSQVLIRKEQIEDAYFVIEGNNDTQGTTTSTSTADIVTIGSLSIPVTDTIVIVASLKKTTGAANSASVGLKLNSSAMRTDVVWTDSNNTVESGQFYALILPHDATYLRTAYIRKPINIRPDFFIKPPMQRLSTYRCSEELRQK